MADLLIALCQLASAGTDTQANLVKALAACSQAAAHGADVVVLPELWQIGYTPCPDEPAGRAAWQDLAVGPDDPWLAAFHGAARTLDLAILVPFLERWPGAPRNSAVLIDRHGQTVLHYAKVHTCDFSMETALTPGESFEVGTLQTRHGSVRMGVMICYDREFPESARELMLGGAEVILVPNACEMTEDRLGQLRARAFENMVAVALANFPTPEHGGRSCGFDGVAYWPDGQPRDHEVVRAGVDEEVVYARIDLDLLRQYRAIETWADAYRKPSAYRRLRSADPPLDVFTRADSRRTAPVQSTPARPVSDGPTHLDEELDAVLIGGREPVTVVVVDSDPTWPERYETERARLVAALGPVVRRIEHIGSTAVPGLAAKPIIDILVEVDDPDAEDGYRAILEAAGYQLRVREPRHRMFRTPARDVHVHLWPTDSQESADYLGLRNWLRTHANDRARYEQAKRALSGQAWRDMNYYAEAKGPVIAEIRRRAGSTG